jgi:hypothetical protein
MATGFVSKLNKIQSERAVKAGLSDNGVSNAIKDMAAAGQFPRGKTYVESDSTDRDGLRTLVFFDKTKGKWVFQQSIAGKIQNHFEGATKGGVFEMVEQFAQRVEDEHDPEYLTCKAWLRESRWGREFATFECLAAWQQLEKYVPRGGVTILALDHAFTTILDKEDNTQNWFRFIQKRDRLERERIQAEQASTPHENLPSQDSDRKDEDNANKATPMAELRRRALFGGRVKTTPSTGTRLIK